MDADPFVQSFEIVVGFEGGYDANAADPGNWTGGAVRSGVLRGTKFGISAGAYPTLDISSLTLQQAQDIYRRDYWNRIEADSLAPPLALLVFDAAVNNGVGRAIRWLQMAAGAAPDGVLGPATRSAIDVAVKHGGAALCAEFQAQRLAFMANLPTWRTFGLGWARRLCSLPYESLKMTGAAQ